jgi:hypothetical protein
MRNVVRQRMILASTALIVLALATVEFAACGGGSRCSPYPACAGPTTVRVSASEIAPKLGANVSFTVETSLLHNCKATYAWDFNGTGTFESASARVTRAFSTPGHRVVSVRVKDCVESVVGATNVWVLTSKLKCPTKLKPFDLWSVARDLNGLPLNPEWRWQCDYPGFPPMNSPAGAFPAGATYPDAFPDQNVTCNQFRLDADGKLDVGSHCSTQDPRVDVPTDPVWYAICHFTSEPPYQEGNGTVHGHVNWRDVTYTGGIAVQQIQSDFPFGDGDVDLDMTTESTGVYQPLTPTMPGVTLGPEGNTRPIHLEFNDGEVLQAFPASAEAAGYTWSAALGRLASNPGPSVYGVATGLFGLDARHGSYSELHPIYGLALREAAGATFSRWLILARNGGSEGGCSSQGKHWLEGSSKHLTFQLPLPASASGKLSTTGSYYSANFTPTPQVAVTPAGGAADVTVQLPPPPTYGVVAGELLLQTAPTPSLAQVRPHLLARPPAALPLTVPPTLEEPEQSLAGLAELVAPKQRATMSDPLARRQRAPMSASAACALLRTAADTTSRSARTEAEAQLAKQICRAAGTSG